MRAGGLEVLTTLGSGSTGVVYLCDQPSLGRRVAVKRLAAALAADPAVRERFLDAARRLARLSDHHCVAVYDLGEEAEGPYVVLEHVPGASLRALLADHGRLSVEQALGAVTAVLAGLAHAHDLGVVHGDLRPAKVLVTPDGSAKVTGFGLAPALAHGGYLSPEQRRGQPPAVASDVYLAGMVLAAALAGEPLSDPAAALGELPRSLRPVTARAMAEDPAGRYATAAEFAAALNSAAEEGLGSGWTARAGLAGLVAAALAGGGVAGGAAVGGAVAGGTAVGGTVVGGTAVGGASAGTAGTGGSAAGGLVAGGAEIAGA
ncbi:MAG: serine/threonine-protein kinase, partial [Mycobacteriales bacterium]